MWHSVRQAFTFIGIARIRAAAVVLGVAFAFCASAQEIGQIKTARGEVTIVRQDRTLPGTIGARLQTSDTVRTGADGSVGITMADDSLLSAGPNSVLSLDRFSFDPTTNRGRLDASLSKGTLAVISGRIAKQSPEAMTVRTQSAILGVRGTEFVVRAAY
jgi:hypothetical protein